ncbi:MAG: FAD-dependent oxidoreductase [Deltaproteobacteria bacterium]|nr:FAD-dependent oxidoreductase [Deltaproteobacteria bacterium]
MNRNVKKKYHVISGKQDGGRIDSRILEERIQNAVKDGYTDIKVDAYGQHGIGGRLWAKEHPRIHLRIEGHSGQRVGAMGFPKTFIEVMGPASDDLGWLNAGAHIVVHGNAANGAGNAMAQGKIYVAGNIGARGMTMTKRNPRFDPPELWVLGSVGDYFGEFMAGGIAVVCGVNPQNPDNVLGYRPFVGMVGGRVYFRGPHGGFSEIDAKLVPMDENDWNWLKSNLKEFLEKIGRYELFSLLADPEQWQLLVARSPQERTVRHRRSMESFRSEVWDTELGQGGLIGDLTDIERSPIPLITTGALRRFVPVWENRKFAPPCEASCPTGIPVHERWRLIRDGRVDEAVNMALSYTPFPATVCGYLCPNLCMKSCTRQSANMVTVDVTQLGKASIDAKLPELPPTSGKRIAVIGGGPAGISVAWQLRQRGHESVIYDTAGIAGGKIASVIPESRIPGEVVSAELKRMQKVIPHVHLKQAIKKEDFDRLKADFDFIVIATGARRPIPLAVAGSENLIPANEFLMQAKENQVKPGLRVVVIGAGNVGCDVATEAHRLGAREITLIDIQKPASFGKERKAAEAIGARFRWPVFTEAITEEGVKLKSGEIIAADTVVLSIGELPELEFLPDDVATANGFIVVNDWFQTSDPRVFAIGDVVKPGLLTDAIGAGRKAASAIADMLEGKQPVGPDRPVIDQNRIRLEYFDPRIIHFEDINQCGTHCSSCGTCRDCGVCVSICPEGAISKIEKGDTQYEYVVDEDRCIGCGFCAGACPCGVWNLIENKPLEQMKP